ncbi:ABC transporter ATP-binding protein [Pseudobacteriovorax antillogorgiicola]|uniref:Amino acid/amide ABC transporter ATP-binding protein 1, HAAT family n=1 Tax=Pseudobacteriovorax antillogorgiicola TaxID=1513793 RepID=A0A1Y6CN68_9BACT|nr:ATP-binding cassette domain-containing protein [Pseudobacteriovorax antillogorgiicola]TCS44417.1 amino acid/amide ABC transporter ATP-binding protein 1 (HAAT family) [Pseudobacteriovorax antillogorgiicola]SMF79112.1 amino acid/amide ABC transporter ATP-binding protein 1, HAAT family [Pseudobacteriovorax antillogorgiicola]
MDDILKVDSLGVSFGGIRALDQVSFEVAKGSVTAIIGPNGAGKTTVFNCLTGFYKASDGRIQFQDKNRTHSIEIILGQPFTLQDFVNPISFGRKLFYKMFGGSHQVAALGISRTFQNIRLFKDMTAIENLLVAQHRSLNKNILANLFNTRSFRDSEAQAIKKAKEWLAIVGLTADADRLAGELPYGHQRRLEIARAMCTDAKLICLDEPAAGLNHNETKDLSNLISRLRTNHNVTVCVIEHDMSLVMEVSDHIIVLDHGNVIARGTPTEIRNNPVVLKAYLGEE